MRTVIGTAQAYSAFRRKALEIFSVSKKNTQQSVLTALHAKEYESYVMKIYVHGCSQRQTCTCTCTCTDTSSYFRLGPKCTQYIFEKKKKKNIIVYSKRACLIAPFETSVRVELHQMSLKICHMAGIGLEEDDYYGYLTELIYKPDAAETVICFLLLLFGG